MYGTKKVPTIIDVPIQRYLMISGKGNPNDEDFSNRVATLYALAYAIKMGYKATATKGGVSLYIHDFAVYPLEGVWKQKQDDELVKETLEYTIMIRQPDLITGDMVCAAMERVKIKKPNDLYGAISFDTMQDGKCIEILHIGSFDDEPTSFEKWTNLQNKMELNELRAATENYI